MSCCNNIYPESDLRRWESCDSVQLANADNFYSKKEVDDLLDDIVVSGDGITADEAQDLIDSSLEDYYDKDEIDAAFDSVNDELDGKLDASAYTPTDLSQYWTSSQTVDYVDSVITDNSDIFVVNWGSIRSQQIMTDELWNNLMHAIDNNKPIFGYIENQPNAIFDEIYPLQVLAMDVYGIKNIRLTLVAQTYSTTVDITKNGSEDYTIAVDGFEFQTKLTAGSGISIDENNVISATGGSTDLSNYYTKSETNNLLDDKLDASAYTPTDLSGYYTKSQVDALIEALQAQIDDLSDCCSGSGDTGSTEGMKWVLHMNNGQSASLICDAPNDQFPHQIDDDEFVHTHRVFNTSDELSSITSAYVGECVYGIMDNGFSGCTNMSSITVSDNLVYIGANAFRGCENLENFPYSTGLEVISGSAFAHCYSLTHANIPSGVTEIGSWVFQDCTGLTQVVVEGTTPPTLGNWAFYNEYGTAQLDITIYVPSSAENTYKTAVGWSEYASRIQAIQ